jgi:hypothetical protein
MERGEEGSRIRRRGFLALNLFFIVELQLTYWSPPP